MPMELMLRLPFERKRYELVIRFVRKLRVNSR
jgi:hypothetical protein